MNTTFITKRIAKHKRSAIGTTSLGLSAAAVIWLYHTFVTLDEYKQDKAQLQQQVQQLWKAVGEKHNKP